MLAWVGRWCGRCCGLLDLWVCYLRALVFKGSFGAREFVLGVVLGFVLSLVDDEVRGSLIDCTYVG